MSAFATMRAGLEPDRDPRPDGTGADASLRRDAPVLILAGGTGGHIFPGIAVAQNLRSRGVPVLWLGSDGGLETRLVPQAGIELRTIAVRGVRGKGLATKLLAPFRILRATFDALREIGAARPRCALSLGGFAAGPGGIAAWLRRVPLLVHEQNRVAGATNRILSHFSRMRLCGFSGALAGGEWLGNPVRGAIAAVALPPERFAGRGGPLRLLVLGGSQGARSLNRVLPQVLGRAALGLEVRHQAGPKLLDDTLRAYADAGVSASVEPFIDDMAAAYAWADLVVCRAGALTIAELCAAGVGALLVPFPAAVDDHQTRNAAAMVEAGAGRIVAEGDAFAERLGAALTELCAGDTRARLAAMARAARTLARPDAAARIADRCLEVAA
jgi:UDP-N-acetylglucosamine--N-acetylmuramyl-(pentapeptide) pyrophosphoryl-undecaprenol N-acetylglucosamine transferase